MRNKTKTKNQSKKKKKTSSPYQKDYPKKQETKD